MLILRFLRTTYNIRKDFVWIENCCRVGEYNIIFLSTHKLGQKNCPKQSKHKGYSGSMTTVHNIGFSFSCRQHKRHTFDSVQDFNVWKGLVLLISGFVGGIFTAMTGSGTCICSFSVLCLLFRYIEHKYISWKPIANISVN